MNITMIVFTALAIIAYISGDMQTAIISIIFALFAPDIKF